MKYLLGIDFGGGSTKATLIDTEGNIVAENSVEYPTYHPTPAACEQKAEDWLLALKENIASLGEKSKIDFKDIECVAIDSATHTSLICDENYAPIRPAIHWTDTRSRKQADKLLAELGDELFKKTFHRPSTIWTLPQLIWLKENEPENFEKTRYIFFEKDYIRFALTGVFCTDYIEAEGSMLFDCNKMEWDEELCALAGLKVDMLPRLVAPTDMIGKVTKEASEIYGLPEGLPVVCGTTDTVMEVFASGAVSEGDVTVKLATAGRICVITNKPYPDTHLVNYSHVAKGLWYPGTATKSAAASYRWYRDTFGGSYKELDMGASEIPLGCEGLVFLPHLNGELTPYADPMLCGSFTGVRSTHTKAHFTRAVLEGVSLSLLDSKIYLDNLGMKYKEKATLIGGGGKGRLWAQITSDMLGIPLRITESSDSSLGSAMLAGVACGVFKNAEEAAAKCVKEVDTVYPNPENTAKYRKLYDEYKKIHDALAPIYRER
ncbi:MAG: xylulokinase [Ruminococcaceae bacterium]|nr:xylulokinase [Oscillospiraceae bacterium]